MITTHYKQYFIVALVYLFIDIVWIYSTNKLLYSPMVENVQSTPMVPRLQYAVGAYLFLIVSIWFICIPLKKYYITIHNFSNIKATVCSFGIVGLVIYAVYNFTNATIFKNYPFNVVLIDSMWGFVLFNIIGYKFTELK